MSALARYRGLTKYVRTWGRFSVYLLNAILRCVTGYLLIRHPDTGAEGVTMVLAALFIAGGLFRVVGASPHSVPAMEMDGIFRTGFCRTGRLFSWPPGVQQAPTFIGIAIGVNLI